MDISLSDVLTCPRCGPTYGLVVVPTEMGHRWVESGLLGCANCRERYPVERGVADLRVSGTGESPAALGGSGTREGAVRLAALLGLAEGSGVVVLAGPAAEHGGWMAALLPDVEVVVVDGTGSPGGGGGGAEGGDGEGSGDGRVSAVHVTAALPFRDRGVRGVALSGSRVSLLEEAGRALASGGRLVLDPAPSDAAGRLGAAGLEVVAEEGEVVVAVRGR